MPVVLRVLEALLSVEGVRFLRISEIRFRLNFVEKWKIFLKNYVNEKDNRKTMLKVLNFAIFFCMKNFSSAWAKSFCCLNIYNQMKNQWRLSHFCSGWLFSICMTKSTVHRVEQDRKIFHNSFRGLILFLGWARSRDSLIFKFLWFVWLSFIQDTKYFLTQNKSI